MSVVCLDTMILIWAIKEQATPGQEYMISRSKALVERLQKADIRILVPTIVMGEFLIKLDEPRRIEAISVITRDFLVAPYDARAAVHFAKLCSTNNDFEELFSRQQVKADRMIIATAITHHAERIYSHDHGVQTFAVGHIEVCEVPLVPQQDALPGM